MPITDYTIRPTATSLGRTCQYFTGTADNPFGYGLSYTTFRYSNITVDQTSITANQTLRVRARIANQGTVAGSEVPQLYVTTPFEPASAQRPIKRLEGFSKISGRWVTVSPPSRRPCDTTGTATAAFVVNVAPLAITSNNSTVFVAGRARSR